MNIILCGYNWTGCKALELLLLLRKDYNVFVYTHKSPYYIPDLTLLCGKYNIPYSLENISKTSLPFKPDIICSIFYRYIISKEVIDACNGKIFNLHPSLLPKYRGCSSLTWAMINGEKETGFTYHYIDEKCDTGNIILQRRIAIEEFDTQISLYQRVMFEAMKYFLSVFNSVKEDFSGYIQEGKSSYYKRGCPYDGKIDGSWAEEKIKRFIRALNCPPLPPAKFDNKEIYCYEDYLNLVW